MSHSHGVLLINLGTPDAPTPQAIKTYLKEFLSDPYVVSLPKTMWSFLLDTIILPCRAPKTTALYQTIWLPEGSPLLVHSKKLTHALAQQLQCEVILAMRYGNPSLRHALKQCKDLNLKKLIILPLYPQFSSSTTTSAFECIKRELMNLAYQPECHFISSFFDNDFYINALSEHIAQFWERHGRGNKLLFSFHGLPVSAAKKDRYSEQCYKTAELIAKKLSLKNESYCVVFQSRFGFQKWLTPTCADTLQTLAKQGIKHIDIICPGFITECLETLEEIAIRNKHLFLKAGGRVFHYIPALSENETFIKGSAGIADSFLFMR